MTGVMRRLALMLWVVATVLLASPSLAASEAAARPAAPATGPKTPLTGVKLATVESEIAAIRNEEATGGLPLWFPATDTEVPYGFSSDAAQAIAVAKATPELLALHRREHPLRFYVTVFSLNHWEVFFNYKGTDVAEVDVSRSGRVTAVYTGPLVEAQWAHGHYEALFDSPWVWLTFGLMFLLVLFDPRRPLRLLHLDGLVLLSFGASYALFNATHIVAAVWAVYPPLLYILGRLLVVGFRRRGSPGRRWDPWLPTWALAAGLLALVGARIGLNLASGRVLDVGYASVIGAHRILHDQSLYFATTSHIDTYGPIAYLAYVPFEALFPWHGLWDYLPSAHAATITFDLVTIAGLVLLGMRLRPGASGRRLGLALGWAWSAFPFTLLGIITNVNDGLVAMLLVLALLALSVPAARGALIGLAAAAKFSPAILLPLFARGLGKRRWREALTCVATFAAVTAFSVWLYLPSGGIAEFYRHTIGYQLTRVDVFSVWALHPSLSWLKLIVEIGALALAVGVAFTSRSRSTAQFAALAGALMIAVQLPAVHWFYYYIVWFLPFVLVGLLAREPAAAVGALAPSLDDESESVSAAPATLAA